jgi:hypothetical protein
MAEGSCGDAVFEVAAGNHHRRGAVVSAACGCDCRRACGCDCDCDSGCDCDCGAECRCGEGKAFWELDDTGSRARQVPVQWVCDCAGCRLYWRVDGLSPGQLRRYLLTSAGCDAAPSAWDTAGCACGCPAGGGVHVALQPGEQADFATGGQTFTSYVFRGGIARPYCYPVLGPGGLEVTNLTPPDHVHHKSMYVAQGEVNGQDNWSEMPGHASTVNTGVKVVAQGPVLGAIRSGNDWMAADGRKLLREVTRITVYDAGPDARRMDWRILWRADYGGVHFGDTKEAGTIAVRVAESMEESRGGRIVNAHGGVSEAECWGKRSPWVDYHGPVGDQVLGIALFDHPDNLRHPTWWHVRSYGLFTANEWGLHDFTGDWAKRGDYVLPAGQALAFNFRVYIHRGCHREADVAGRYLDYAAPPEVRRLEA